MLFFDGNNLFSKLQFFSRNGKTVRVAVSKIASSAAALGTYLFIPLYLSIYLSVCECILRSLSIFLSTFFSISIFLYVHLSQISFYLSFCLFVNLSLYLSMQVPFILLIYLSMPYKSKIIYFDNFSSYLNFKTQQKCSKCYSLYRVTLKTLPHTIKLTS